MDLMAEVDGHPLDELILAAWATFTNGARFVARKEEKSLRALSPDQQKAFRLVYLEAARRSVAGVDEPAVMTGNNDQLATFVSGHGLPQTRDQIAGAVFNLNRATATTCRGRVQRAGVTYVVSFHVAEADTHYFWFDLDRERDGGTESVLRVSDYVRARKVENVLDAARARVKDLILEDATARGKRSVAEQLLKTLYAGVIAILILAGGTLLAYTTIPRFRAWVDRVILRKMPPPVAPPGPRRSPPPRAVASQPPAPAPATEAPSVVPARPVSPPRAIRGTRVGNLVYVPRGRAGLQVFDVTMTKPRLAWSFPLTNAVDVALSGPFVYVAGDADGLHVIDSRKVPTEALLSTLSIGYPVRDVVVDGTHLLVAAAHGGLYIYDIGTPDAPRIVGRLLDTEHYFNGSMERIYVRGPYVFAAQGPAKGVGAGLCAYDISDVRRPHLVSTLATAEPTAGMAVFNQNIAVIGRRSIGLWFVDLTNPHNLNTVGFTQTAEEIENVAAVDEKTVVAIGMSGTPYFVRYVPPRRAPQVVEVDAWAAAEALQKAGVILLDKDTPIGRRP
jgi:hypothetical protein